MSGVPTLASDFPEIGRVVREAGGGMLVDPPSLHAIAAALGHMLADRPALAEMGRRARQAAVGQYNWDHEVRVLLTLYES